MTDAEIHHTLWLLAGKPCVHCMVDYPPREFAIHCRKCVGSCIKVGNTRCPYSSYYAETDKHAKHI